MLYFAIYDKNTLAWVGISGRVPDPSTIELEDNQALIVSEEQFSVATHRVNDLGEIEPKDQYRLTVPSSVVKVGETLVIGNVPKGTIVGFARVPHGATIDEGEFGFYAEESGRFNLYFHNVEYVTIIIPIEVIE